MKVNVEYYSCETQTEEVEAASKEDAEKQVLDSLAHDHAMIGRPTDWTYGVRGSEVVEDEEESEVDE